MEKLPTANMTDIFKNVQMVALQGLRLTTMHEAMITERIATNQLEEDNTQAWADATDPQRKTGMWCFEEAAMALCLYFPDELEENLPKP